MDVNALLHSLAALFLTAGGWYINRMARERDRFADNTAQQFRDLDIRVQFLENRAAVAETKHDAQALAIDKLGESLDDIRSNMVRREDLEALVAQINRRRGK